MKDPFKVVLWVAFVLSAIVTLAFPVTEHYDSIQRAAEEAYEKDNGPLNGKTREERMMDRSVDRLVRKLAPVGQFPTILVISAGFLAVLYSLDRREKKGL
jgi:hypothetical protein